MHTKENWFFFLPHGVIYASAAYLMGQGSVMFLACPSVVRAEAGAFLDRFAVDLQLKLVVTW